MQQEQTNNNHTLAAPPEHAGGPASPMSDVVGRSMEAFPNPGAGRSQSGIQGAFSPGEAAPGEEMRAVPGQASCQSQTGPGDVWSGNAGASANGCEEGGFRASPEMIGGRNPGAAPQQMGPIAGPEVDYGYYTHNRGPYGNPTDGAHMAGPGMGLHSESPYPYGCFPHHSRMYWHPPQGPHWGAAEGPHPGMVGAAYHGPEGAHNNGPFAGLLGKALQGQATPQDLLGGLLNLNFQDDQFWKGVVVGSVAALLFSSQSVRQALTGALVGVFQKPPETTENDDQPRGKDAPDTKRS